MANCTSCSAPLPPHSGVCAYCGASSDIDLKAIHEYTVSQPESLRTCPVCELPLHTLDLNLEGKFLLERCENCFGLFFDPGELEALLEKSVSNVFAIDLKRLDSLARERQTRREPVVYRKCPVCRELMNRINFGHRSGVILDQCKSHGVWLDGGELKLLLDWRKAGGQLLHEEIRERREKDKQREERSRARAECDPLDPLAEPLPLPSSRRQVDLLATLADFFRRRVG